MNPKAPHSRALQKSATEITPGDHPILLTENRSIDIPLGEEHRPANLVIIEVQSGSDHGENDIVRFEDHSGRNEP